MSSPFDNFLVKFEKSFKANRSEINNTLANVFSMRVIGNKTHGDLAEIALTEYINQHVNGFTARHTGKEKFRAKQFEEDISVSNDFTNEVIPISIKAYGVGPLQLSTNKDGSMFAYLKRIVGKGEIRGKHRLNQILKYKSFANIDQIYILPLIYKEKKKRDGNVVGGNFKIIVFDIKKAYKTATKVSFVIPGKRGRKHPIYSFYDGHDKYLFEIRYGDATANALQRGMWTHTENARSYFRLLLSGSYRINESLINLISRILVTPQEKHKEILRLLPRSKQKSVI